MMHKLMLNNCRERNLEGGLDETMISTVVLTKLERGLIARVGDA